MARIEMTLNKALARKKRLQEQLDNLRSERMDDLVAIRFENKEELTNHMSIAAAERMLQSRYDSTVAVLNNYLSLTMAINRANNETEIDVGGQRMSIALAITYKNTLEKEKSYWKKLSTLIELFRTRVNEINEDKLSTENVNRTILALTSSDSADDVTPEKILELKAQYVEDNKVGLYDPMLVAEKSAAKLKEIEDLEENINEILTIANCNTIIAVDFED